MGYFSNGAEGRHYENQYCSRCIHRNNPQNDYPGCPVWGLQLQYNYDLCNEKDTFLDVLIPRNKGTIGNQRCTMFREDDKDHETLDMFERVAA
jgi:hypothetical protein